MHTKLVRSFFDIWDFLFKIKIFTCSERFNFKIWILNLKCEHYQQCEPSKIWNFLRGITKQSIFRHVIAFVWNEQPMYDSRPNWVDKQSQFFAYSASMRKQKSRCYGTHPYCTTVRGSYPPKEATCLARRFTREGNFLQNKTTMNTDIPKVPNSSASAHCDLPQNETEKIQAQRGPIGVPEKKGWKRNDGYAFYVETRHAQHKFRRK